MQNNDAGGFTLSDKQYDHFLHTMTNPAPPTPAMMKAAEDIDRLQRNRRYHEIAKELGIGPGCSVDDHNRIMQILNAPNAPPVSPFARKEGK